MATFVTDILRALAMAIVMGFSGLIGTLYDVIIALGSSRIFNNDFYVSFAGKIGLLLGIFMLFRLVFSLINYLIDPDKISDKKEGAGKIVVRLIIVIALLASYNTMFNALYKVQEEIINSDLLVTLFYDKDDSIIQNGGKFALQYSPVIASITKRTDSTALVKIPSSDELIKLYSEKDGESSFRGYLFLSVVQKESALLNVPILGSFISDLNSLSNGKFSSYTYKFDAIPCLLFMGFIVYSMFIYSIKLGTRVAQLAFMQMIAPVPIIAYIDPKSDALKKWGKLLISSYIEIFVMMAIFYFIGFFSYKMIGSNALNVNNASFGSEWIVKLMIMCGVLIMANKFPDMLKKIFNLGDSGDYGLGLKKTLAPIDPLIRGTRTGIAGVGGGVAGAVGAIKSGAKGSEVATAIWRGSKEGFKSKGHIFGSIYGGYHGGARIGYDRSMIEAEGEIDDEEVKEMRLAMRNGQLDSFQLIEQQSNRADEVNSSGKAVNSAADANSIVASYKKDYDKENLSVVERTKKEELYKNVRSAFIDSSLAYEDSSNLDSDGNLSAAAFDQILIDNGLATYDEASKQITSYAIDSEALNYIKNGAKGSDGLSVRTAVEAHNEKVDNYVSNYGNSPVINADGKRADGFTKIKRAKDLKANIGGSKSTKDTIRSSSKYGYAKKARAHKMAESLEKAKAPFFRGGGFFGGRR